MNFTILGGGLSALSLAYYLQKDNRIDRITLIEKDNEYGGICRSYYTKGICWDVGPHIFFSKDKEILGFMNDLIKDNCERHRRSNRILHKKIFVQYPFENDLSKLPKEDKDYCVNGFVHNPYENYAPSNMLQFFLKTFGEGITNTYLRPYNEKIWKFDPSFMDTQMVERIPKPPKEDILRSAAGETVDGYTHQLYFTYPREGGTDALIKALRARLNAKVDIVTSANVTSVCRIEDKFHVECNNGDFNIVTDKLISTIPLDYFVNIYKGRVNPPQEVIKVANSLKHNSIAIVIANVKKDAAGDNYAFMIADKKVIFHRMSKLDFMGNSYHLPNSTSYMMEITYRKNDMIDKTSDTDLIKQVVDGLIKIGFIDSEEDVNFTSIKRFDYAYVIYDLMHKTNKKIVVDYLKNEDVYVNGRFGSFEYLNMDAIIKQSKNLALEILNNI